MKPIFQLPAARGLGERLLWIAGWINLLIAALVITATLAVPGVLP